MLAKLRDITPDRQVELIKKAKAGEKVSAKAEIKKAQRRNAKPMMRRRQSAIPRLPRCQNR